MEPRSFENELTEHSHREAGEMAAFHDAYDDAVAAVRADLGGRHPAVVDGDPVETGEWFTVSSPGELDLTVGEFAAGDPETVHRAVAAARETFADWRDWPPDERAALFRDAAAELRSRKFRLAATLSLENGKNRPEAMADVDEAIDFLRFYAREYERNDGYVYDTGRPTPDQHCTNLLRPYGVFGVVAPFNFPVAILAGMTTGAVVTGNTAVVKPASATPLVAHEFLDALSAAGVPDGVVNLVTGGGSDVGQPLVEHEDVAGVAFTGSREVGLGIQRTFVDSDKHGPVIAELGGKNPVIVTGSADLDDAVEGVTMGAFGFSGQKCSATSRVYVERGRVDRFVDRVVAAAEDLPIAPPTHRDAVMAPVVDDAALARYRDVCERAAAVGTVHTGDAAAGDDEFPTDRVPEGVDLPDGRYVAPTVVTGVPHEHDLAREEHFLPFVTVHPVDDLDEAIAKANDSDYGLCAGLFAADEGEVETWLDRIESGMCYVNRARSATTGALVQGQPFGGWKYSGTTGKFAGGYWYLPQFMREQSRTVVRGE
ncbi:MAG: aldehyde dehydrogenase family protein [Halobacteriaceae archaeon]